jgi:hypothetical protein
MGYSHITDEDIENFGIKIQDARKIYNYLYLFLLFITIMFAVTFYYISEY